MALWTATAHLIIGNQARDAEGKRAAPDGRTGRHHRHVLQLSAGVQMTPHVSLDGLTMREEGYTENGGGDGLDLQVAPYYANSLRGSVGSDFKTNFDLWGATITPEARLGYRYDVGQHAGEAQGGLCLDRRHRGRPATPSPLSAPIRTPATRWRA